MTPDTQLRVNVLLELMGYKRLELGHHLGGDYKKWQKGHVDRLMKLIDKRIEAASNYAKKYPELDDFVEALEAMQRHIWEGCFPEQDIMRRVFESKKSLTLDKMRTIAKSNNVSLSKLERAAGQMGAERIKRVIDGRSRAEWRIPE